MNIQKRATIDALLGIAVCLLLTGVRCAPLEDSFQDRPEQSLDVSKRGWNMLRLGRGLQMLRLGKRGYENLRLGRDNHRQGQNALLNPELQAMLDSLFDQPRDETRRQPPLPRYGRDNSNARRNLLDAIGSDGFQGSSLELFPEFSNDHFFYRPAPRGGRYKRSISLGQLGRQESIMDYFSPNAEKMFRQRALSLPRYERLEKESHVEPKAVPRPRIGRDESEVGLKETSQSL